MIEWAKVPWSLWLYVALGMGGPVVVVFTASMPVAPLVFFIAFTIAVSFFLLRGIRWLWIALVAISALSVAIDLAAGTGTWYGDLVGVIGLVLLLLPATRRFFGIGETAAAI